MGNISFKALGLGVLTATVFSVFLAILTAIVALVVFDRIAPGTNFSSEAATNELAIRFLSQPLTLFVLVPSILLAVGVSAYVSARAAGCAETLHSTAIGGMFCLSYLGKWDIAVRFPTYSVALIICMMLVAFGAGLIRKRQLAARATAVSRQVSERISVVQKSRTRRGWRIAAVLAACGGNLVHIFLAIDAGFPMKFDAPDPIILVLLLVVAAQTFLLWWGFTFYLLTIAAFVTSSRSAITATIACIVGLSGLDVAMYLQRSGAELKWAYVNSAFLPLGVLALIALVVLVVVGYLQKDDES